MLAKQLKRTFDKTTKILPIKIIYKIKYWVLKEPTFMLAKTVDCDVCNGSYVSIS